MVKIHKKDEPLIANFATFENVSYHLNATPLNKAKMGRCLRGGLLSLSLSLSLVARTFWHTKIFKCFVFGLFTLVIASRFCENGGFCHFERSDPTGCKAQAAAKKSTHIKRKLAILGYFACAQYDKFGLLFKNNGYFHSNFRDKIYKFYSFFWIATLALLARNDGKAQIQIFHSKFKAFCKFNSFHKFYSKFNSFYKFISKFKPYTRLFYIFTPNFRAVFTDKFSRKEELWQQLAQKAGQEQSHRLKATGNAAKPTK